MQNQNASLSNSPYPGKDNLAAFCAKRTKLGFFALYQECQKD